MLTLSVVTEIGTATVENNMENFQKNKNKSTILPTNSTTSYISEKNINLERYMHPNVHSTIIYNSQDTATTQVSVNRWMDKEDVL